MKIKITVENKLKRGRNIGTVTAFITSPNESHEYKAINFLENYFGELPDGVRCNSVCWGKMQDSWDGYLQFVHETKYKKDHMSGEEILGFLTSRYGDLDKYIRACIVKIAAKRKLIERAKDCMREAEHVGGCYSDEAYKKAKAKINYDARLKELNDELRSVISDEYDHLIDIEDWKYQGGKKVDPVSVQLILSKTEHFKDRAMPGRGHLPRSFRNLFNEYGAHWLAAAIESMEESK